MAEASFVAPVSWLPHHTLASFQVRCLEDLDALAELSSQLEIQSPPEVPSMTRALPPGRGRQKSSAKKKFVADDE